MESVTAKILYGHVFHISVKNIHTINGNGGETQLQQLNIVKRRFLEYAMNMEGIFRICFSLDFQEVLSHAILLDYMIMKLLRYGADLFATVITMVYENGIIYGADRESARIRLERLKDRPQFISHEGSVEETKKYLNEVYPHGRFTFLSLPYRIHTDTWVLRDIPERKVAAELDMGCVE